MLDWQRIAKALGTTTVLVAVLGFLAGNIFNFVLARMAARVDAELTRENAQKERIRDEVVRWSNPILTAVNDLEDRLENIQEEDGYLALSKNAKDRINQQWSMSYEYFLPSSVFLFSRYFCAVGLLEESLSFELFRKHEVKDAFFSRVYAVEEALSVFPNDELSSIADTRDRQVFGLQLRGVGEALAVSTKDSWRCMRYSEFAERWKEPSFQKAVEPMTTFLDGLGRDNPRPWMRLTLMAAALEQLRIECRRQLSLEGDDSAAKIGRRRARL